MESSLLDKTRAHLKSERIEYSQMNNHNCSSICDTKKFFHHFVGSTSFKKTLTCLLVFFAAFVSDNENKSLADFAIHDYDYLCPVSHSVFH